MRLRLDLVPNPRSTVITLLSNIVKRPELNLAKKLSWHTHARAAEMKLLFRDAGIENLKFNKAIDKVCDACNVCVSGSRSHFKQRFSINYMNDGFNSEIQIDFLTVRALGNNFKVLNIVNLDLHLMIDVSLRLEMQELLLKSLRNVGCADTEHLTA